MSLSASERELARSGAVAALARESSGGLELEVQGDCMRPWLEPGQTVGLEAARRLAVPGDVIAVAASDGSVLVHRLLGYRRSGGETEVLTSSDAGSGCDAPVATKRVLGRVIWVADVDGARRSFSVPPGVRLRCALRWAKILGVGLLRSAGRAPGREP